MYSTIIGTRTYISVCKFLIPFEGLELTTVLDYFLLKFEVQLDLLGDSDCDKVDSGIGFRSTLT